MKRLSDAKRDRNTVYGIVRGSSMQHNGRGASFVAPTITSQEALIRAALKDANLVPEDFDIIEAHGTATALGDPVEVSALTKVFGKRKRDPLLVGSVKANTGHVEAAAGMIGLVKFVMTLGYKHMPPNAQLRCLNENVETAVGDGCLSFPQTLTDLGSRKTADHPKLIGDISGFGACGTIVHIVMEESDDANIGSKLNKLKNNPVDYNPQTFPLDLMSYNPDTGALTSTKASAADETTVIASYLDII